MEFDSGADDSSFSFSSRTSTDRDGSDNNLISIVIKSDMSIPDIGSVSLSSSGTIQFPAASDPSTVPPPGKATKETMKKKAVSFADDTIIQVDDTIALSIPFSEHVPSPDQDGKKQKFHTVYRLELLFRGVQWSCCKRYRDFEELHRDLQQEYMKVYTFSVPMLPRKRWYNRPRLINQYVNLLQSDSSFLN